MLDEAKTRGEREKKLDGELYARLVPEPREAVLVTFEVEGVGQVVGYAGDLKGTGVDRGALGMGVLRDGAESRLGRAGGL